MNGPDAAAEAERGPAQFAEQLGRLYAENRARLHRFLLRRVGDAGEAEDVTHEAFLRLLGAYGGRPPESPMAMLYRIAVNIVRDGIRRDRFRHAQVAGLTEPVCAVPPESDPETHAAARQRLERLRRAIDRLPPRCREVFLLHKIGGRSHSEVAEMLGISRNMVEKHVIRAFSRLRDELGDTELGR
jgi:RNA polymerase sigma-70 factor (ECF subfamily)